MLDVECFPNLIFRISAVLIIILSLSSAAHAQETQRQYLSGHGKDDAVPWELMCTYRNPVSGRIFPCHRNGTCAASAH
jgi:hypothetical protein